MMQEQKTNILIVDDNPKNLLALEAVLASPQYNLVRANSGLEALKHILQNDFAIILLDVQMPGLNGFETAKLIKKRKISTHVPIIFITAISQAPDHVMQGYSVGAIDYIFKPFDPETLRSKVEGFVKIHQYREQIKFQGELLRQQALELQKTNEQLIRVASDLRKAEALSRIIGETSIDTFVTFNEQGLILTVNPAVQTMFGYQTDELPGSPVMRLLPLFDPLIRHDCGKIWETVAVRKDNSRFPADIQLGAARIEDQHIFVCSIRDITDRKLMEEERKQQYDKLEKLVEERTLELKNSNRRNESILESISDAFLAVDKQWRFTYLNQEAERKIGEKREALIGKSLWDIDVPSFRNIYEEFHTAMDQRIPVHFEIRMPDSDRWLEVHAYPSETGLSVYFSDITQRKRMEQDLLRSEERFRKIIESSPSLLAIRSLQDSRYLDVNESWLQHTGYGYEEVLQQTSNLLQIAADPGGNTATSGLLELERSVRNAKITYLTKSGEKREGLLSTEVIEIQGEACILSVITDITEKSLLTKEMARLDRLNLVGEMAAGIAHEIRNPMTTVRGFLQISKTRPSPEHIDLMVKELDRANGIITEFLSLARNKTTDRRFQSLNAIIEALFPLIQAEALLSGKTVSLELGNCPLLDLDEKDIRQMILNLAINGLEAMSSGGKLSIITNADPQGVMLEIRDEGSGIKQELLEKLGTPFFTTKEQGTGLGLAICYSVAARHNAVIDVDTGPWGTAFLVLFRAEI
ncbi:PAS domain S-box protein [Ferviditalea candida]|uniref:histidine kinase n=1 Tax=Ferviditalea candida TaxID=3108399 RepID=A0ABU5ZML1_9BACL|nr:PAS domain S-box protein [Paenibacillaceae bacterium T2]